MKKILNILMIAAVALGAVACDNAIDDNLTPEQNGESVSIRVKLPDTRVSLGDYEEGKGYKLSFDEGDELYVASDWSASGGYYFTYTAQEGDEYIFTCTADGVQSIVGTYRYAAYLGGKTQADGAYKFYCDTAAESPKGIVMVVDTHTFGTAPLTFRVAPMLKFTSEHPVTITASKGVFRDGSTKTTYTTKKTGEVYIPLCEVDGETTFTFSMYGQEIGHKTLNLAWNGKIYNFGEIVAPEVEKDVATIAIDGAFTDWEDVKINVVDLPANEESVNIQTIKAYADSDNLNIYAKVKICTTMHIGALLDLDNNNETGGTYWVVGNFANKVKAEAWMENYIIYDNTKPAEVTPGNFHLYNGGWEKSAVEVTGCKPVAIGDTGFAEVEFSIPLSALRPYIKTPYIGVVVYVLKDWGAGGFLPYEDSTLLIPVE